MRRLFLVAATLACATSQSRPRSSAAPGGTIVAANMLDHTVSLIDASNGRTVATLPAGMGPHEVTVSHDSRWALVSNYGPGREPGNTVTVIDLTTQRVAQTIDLGQYRRPHGLAFLPGDTAFLVTSETSRAIIVVAFPSGVVRRTIPTFGRASHMLAVSRDAQRIAIANIADATVTMTTAAGADSVTIAVPRQPEGIAIAADGSEVWVGSNRDSVVTIIDFARRQIIATLRGFGMPYRIALSADGRHAVISDPALGVVRIIDAKSRADLATIAFPRDSVLASAEFKGSPSPEGIAISADGRWAFVTLQGLNRVATIDLSTRQITGYAPTGNWSDGIAHASAR
jgi:DNA-binding beta-propeller fold protein YncE